VPHACQNERETAVISGHSRAPRTAFDMDTCRLTPCLKRPSKQRVTCANSPTRQLRVAELTRISIKVTALRVAAPAPDVRPGGQSRRDASDKLGNVADLSNDGPANRSSRASASPTAPRARPYKVNKNTADVSAYIFATGLMPNSPAPTKTGSQRASSREPIFVRPEITPPRALDRQGLSTDEYLNTEDL
jgi:hypothetical protein